MSVSRALSNDDVRFYQEHGWLISPVRLEQSLLDEAMQGIEKHWAGHRDHTIPGARTVFSDWMPGDPTPTRNNEYLSLQNFQVRKLALSPILGAVASSLVDSPVVRLFEDQMICKPGGQPDSVVGWHVDGDYRSTCSSQKMLTAWIPLHDCPEEFGPLVVLDGSHKWSHLIDRSKLGFRKDMDGLAQYVTELGFEFKPVVIELKRGQFSLHNCRTMHGSYPNRAASPRAAYAVHLQDGDNIFIPVESSDGRPVGLFNDQICRRTDAGLPDYSDDAVFPEIWNRSIAEQQSMKMSLMEANG